MPRGCLKLKACQKKLLRCSVSRSRGKQPDTSTIQDFYSYAFKLEKAGDTEKALEVYKEIDRADPTYKDVRERLQALSPFAEVEEDLGGRTTIRGFIRNGSMDSKNGIRLWLQILKSLQNAYKNGRDYGLLAPDNIAVDSENRISLSEQKTLSCLCGP